MVLSFIDFSFVSFFLSLSFAFLLFFSAFFLFFNLFLFFEAKRSLLDVTLSLEQPSSFLLLINGNCSFSFLSFLSFCLSFFFFLYLFLFCLFLFPFFLFLSHFLFLPYSPLSF